MTKKHKKEKDMEMQVAAFMDLWEEQVLHMNDVWHQSLGAWMQSLAIKEDRKDD